MSSQFHHITGRLTPNIPSDGIRPCSFVRYHHDNGVHGFESLLVLHFALPSSTSQMNPIQLDTSEELFSIAWSLPWTSILFSRDVRLDAINMLWPLQVSMHRRFNLTISNLVLKGAFQFPPRSLTGYSFRYTIKLSSHFPVGLFPPYFAFSALGMEFCRHLTFLLSLEPKVSL